MKYNEKDIEEYLNTDEVKDQLELHSEIVTLVNLLIQKNIFTEKEFNKINNQVKETIVEKTKEKIKKELENMIDFIKTVIRLLTIIILSVLTTFVIVAIWDEYKKMIFNLILSFIIVILINIILIVIMIVIKWAFEKESER